MFLMNAPPVVALQSRWEAFGPPGTFRFPGYFSESKEEVARASVSARVQMIISSLQHNEATLGMSDGCAMQRGQRAERCRDTKLAASPTVRKEQPAFAACGLAADREPLREGETAGLGPLVLDSDSDDSVDRDIEEAIQEYLKAKSRASRPNPPEPAHSSTPPTLCPPKLAPGSGSVPESSVAASEDQGSASPVSVSSEDSFEQSIQAEIEQFLNEKRQHENQKCNGCEDKKTEPNENLARFKSHREPPTRSVPRQDLIGACKEFVFHKPPRLAKVNAQPRSLRPKVTEPENPGSTRPAAPRPEAAQSRGGKRRSAGAGRRGRRVKSTALVHEASDSSSDDGIEEAIQLYQLEKTRKEAGGDPSSRAQLREEKEPNPPTSGTGSTPQSVVREAHRKAPSKKKPTAAKAVDPTPGGLDPEHLSKLPKDTKTSAPPGHTATRSDSVEQALCRADTSAELMCAEAILDISKTILPIPTEGSGRPPPVSPLFYSPTVPSHSDGDSSSVDSDDSIEQEIRTFLALKAQAGSPQPTQGPLLLPSPNSQTGLPKTPLSKTLDLPLTCKRKRRGGGSSTVRPTVSKKTREVRESVQDCDCSQTKAQPGHDGQDSPNQGKGSEVPGVGEEARDQPALTRTVGLSDAHGDLGKPDEGRSVGEKESSEDKSSSLDSDEDLDMAIKDLLRSKRKVKKRCRDPRAAGKKKVRFSTTETRFVGRLGSLPRDWVDRGPPVLRSCLSKSRSNSRVGPGRRPPGIFNSIPERTKPGGEDAAQAFQSKRKAPEETLFSKDTGACSQSPSAPNPTSLSEDSSVDSDDSIELEIRKFLAEKAKESVSSSEVQTGDPTALGPGAPARPEVLGKKEPVLQSGVCTRSQRTRGVPQLTEGAWGTERAGSQGTASLFAKGGKGAPYPEHITRLPAALGRCEPALPKSTSGTISVKASPASRKNTYVHKDQSPRGAEPATAESAFGQLSNCAKVGTEAGGAGGTFQVNYGSRTFLTSSPGPQADLTLPWSDFAHQSRLPNPWALNSEGLGSVWTGGLGDREQGSEGRARVPPNLTAGPRKNLPFSGFSPLLSTQLFHFGKSASWGVSRLASLVPT
uniref:Protein phosphatase 1 regulatory subunit 26 N-terminal domain-containing protein n=1 Tax=Castor canadensis TaxID=51338 RepID=A0A8C0XIP9_CASCN